LFEFLREKAEAKTDPEKQAEAHYFVDLFEKAYSKNVLVTPNGTKIDIEQGVMQGSVIAPNLFTAYLEHQLMKSPLLKKLILKQQMLGYADDLMFILA